MSLSLFQRNTVRSVSDFVSVLDCVGVMRKCIFMHGIGSVLAVNFLFAVFRVLSYENIVF